MILRMSTLFVRTLREDPADAEVPSHRLLVRAGYIRAGRAGHLHLAAAGLPVLRNIERIVREEMDAIGAQEVQFPALLPREPYEATGRWTEYGDNIFRLKDRKGGDYLLGPTHEEMFTLVVKDLYSSYKDLPLWIYQIQTKYRDEARPRAGLLRGREFVMKDSYSFDVDDEGLERPTPRTARLHQDLRPARVRLRDRQGHRRRDGRLQVGGVPRHGRERRGHLRPLHLVRLRRQRRGGRRTAPAPVPYDDAPAAHAEQTPDTPTIETLVDHLNEKFPRDDRPWTAGDTLKNVLVVLKHPDGTREPVAIGLPGDREVDAKRLEGQLEPIEVEPFDEKDFAQHPSLVKGYIGPGVLGETNESKIRFLVDPRGGRGHPLGDRRERRRPARARPGGRPRLHPRRHDRGRRGARRRPLPELRRRHAGVGPRHRDGPHLPARHASTPTPLDLKVLDENGKLVTVTMGSYGIGVSRAVAAIAENTHDELGLVWPREVAPADVHLVATGKDAAGLRGRRALAAELEAQGLTVLYDDRPKVSPGVKFKDAELIGVPTIVVVGKGLADGVVEVKDRATGERENVAVDDVVAHVVGVVRG